MRFLFSFMFLVVYVFVFAQHEFPGMTSKTENLTNFIEGSIISEAQWQKFNAPTQQFNPDYNQPINEVPCEDCIEILEKRSENERYFVSTENPSNFYYQKSYGALNYFKNGYWVSINSKLKKINEKLYQAENQPNPTGINLSEQKTFITSGNSTVEFNQWKLYGIKNNTETIIASANWSNYQIGQDGIIIKNIFLGIDLELIFTRGSIKSNFIIRKNNYPEYDELVFKDFFNPTKRGDLFFENGSSSNLGIGKVIYSEENKKLLQIGLASVYAQSFEKETTQLTEYTLANNSLGIAIKTKLIDEYLLKYNNIIIDPQVISTNQLNQSSITGSGYDAACFNGYCTYNLSVNSPANSTITNVLSSFDYKATTPCWKEDGAVTLHLGTCRSPSNNSFFYFCPAGSSSGPGICSGQNIPIFSDISTCLPSPSCTSQNLDFSMRFYRCGGSDPSCNGDCIGANSPWLITLVGKTLQFSSSTNPISVASSSVCEDESITVSAITSFGVEPYNYTWSFNSSGTPVIATGATANITFPNPGSITLYTFVTDNCGTTVNANKVITVNEAPVITISPNIQSICSGEGSNLTLTSSISNTIYDWNVTENGVAGASDNSGNGTGSNSTYLLNQTLTTTSNNLGTVNFSINPKSGGCNGPQANITIDVKPLPNVQNPGNETVCANENTTSISFNGTSGAIFNWTNNNTSTGLAQSGTGTISSFKGLNNALSINTSTIEVIPTLDGCDGAKEIFTINILPEPTVNAVPSQTICDGQPTTDVIFTGTGTQFDWNNDNPSIGLVANGSGDIPSFTTSNHTNSANTGIISVTPKTGLCSGSSRNFQITVSPPPTMNTPANITVCAKEQISLIQFTGTAGANYTWTNDNPSIGLAASGNGAILPFISQNQNSASNVALISVTPSFGTCNGTAVDFQISIDPIPSMNSVNPQSLCVGEQTSDILFSGNASSYTWKNDNPNIGLSAYGNGNILSFTPTNTTNSTLTSNFKVNPILGNCVGDTINFSITVKPKITPTFNFSTSYCLNSSPQSLPLTSNDLPIITGNWSPSSITTSTVGSTNYTFTANSNQCSNNYSTNIEIKLNPTISISSKTICAGQNTVLNPTVSPLGGNFLWSNNSTSSSITVSPNNNANYTVNYTVDGCSTTENITVNVNVNVTPTFSQLGPYCQNSSSVILPTKSTNNINGSWSPVTIATSNVGTINYLFIPNSGVCATNQTMTIQTLANITPTFNQIDTLCKNSTPPQFSNNSINGIVGSWNPSFISTSNVGNSTFNFIPNNGQCATTGSMKIIVIDSITPIFDPLGPYCKNKIADPLPNFSKNTPSIHGTWNPTFINTLIADTLSFVFNASFGKCIQNGMMEIIVSEGSVPVINVDVQKGCSPLVVNLKTPKKTSANYIWTADGIAIGTIDSVQHIFSDTGCYDIKLETSLNGCVNTTVLSDLICVENNPNVNFSANPNFLESSNQTIHFDNNTSGATEYFWNFGDGSYSTDVHPTHNYISNSSNYEVTLTATSEFGCINEYSFKIHQREGYYIYIPNAFSPNGDELNQFWGVKISDGIEPEIFDLFVRNRWGEVIWESHDSNSKWNGVHFGTGNLAANDVYSYELRYKFKKTDKIQFISGHFSVIR